MVFGIDDPARRPQHVGDAGKAGIEPVANNALAFARLFHSRPASSATGIGGLQAPERGHDVDLNGGARSFDLCRGANVGIRGGLQLRAFGAPQREIPAHRPARAPLRSASAAC